MKVRGGSFEFSYDGSDYVAFLLPIDNQTFSVSLIDSRKSLAPLMYLLIALVLVTLVAVGILALIFISMGLKSLTVSDLNVKLSETTYQTEKAIAESQAKSAFLSNMSHEIRTPINAVLGMNEMILRECKDESILEYSASIKTAGDTLLGLINDILDFSKIEADKMEIVPVEYELSS
ncbi:MAG: histidine kinase, partial [Eubacterium sp.]|nr:histidine kinase [Eubacterium sp.]